MVDGISLILVHPRVEDDTSDSNDLSTILSSGPKAVRELSKPFKTFTAVKEFVMLPSFCTRGLLAMYSEKPGSPDSIKNLVHALSGDGNRHIMAIAASDMRIANDMCLQLCTKSTLSTNHVKFEASWIKLLNTLGSTKVPPMISEEQWTMQEENLRKSLKYKEKNVLLDKANAADLLEVVDNKVMTKTALA